MYIPWPVVHVFLGVVLCIIVEVFLITLLGAIAKKREVEAKQKAQESKGPQDRLPRG